MPKLTARKVETAKAGKHGDGGGLQLVVAEPGSGKWVFRFQLDGRPREMGLGAYPEMSLAHAREAAAEARRIKTSGRDPIATRDEVRKASAQAAKAVPTFGEIAPLVVADMQAASKNEKVRYQAARHLGAAYCGALLPRPVNEITTTEVASLLRPIWHEKPEVARKLYPAIRRVFDRARVILKADHGIVMPDNPAAWIDMKAHGFQKPKALSRGRHPSLPYDRTGAFMAALRKRDTVAARALEFLILTNARTDAVIGAEWSEIDGDLWTIPLARLKDSQHRDEPFRIPLSPQVVALLKRVSPAASRYIFPGQKPSRPLSNMALLSVVQRMNALATPKAEGGQPAPTPFWNDPKTRRPIVPHGFRATFRTWAEETTPFPHATIEQAMGHSVGSEVERAYRRTDVFARRRGLMTAWADFVTNGKTGDNVVSITRSA